MMRRLITFMMGLAMIFTAAANDRQPERKGSAQGEQFGKELREFKYKYLAQEMSLNPEQQTRFFELYAQLSNERRRAKGALMQLHKALKSQQALTDAEYTRIYESLASEKIAEGRIEKKYDDKFKTFLSPEQICRMKMAEIKFREKIMKMGHRKKGQKSGK